MYPTILAVLFAFATFREDVTHQQDKSIQLRAVAASVLSMVSSPEEAAMLLTLGNAETHWSLRVHAGDCRRNECDGGQARGPWQLHRNGMSAEQWDRMTGVANTGYQTREALARIRLYRARCHTDRGVIAMYLGLTCRSTYPKVMARLNQYRKVLNDLSH